MKVLLPVDGSDLALDAVRYALTLREQGLKLEFVLANVQEGTHLYEVVLAPVAQVLEGDIGAAAGDHSLQSAQALLKAAGAPFESEVATGGAAPMLIEIAERHGCDAIIMGARGMGGLRGALLGSVSQDLLHRASLPVTIVKHQEPAEAA